MGRWDMTEPYLTVYGHVALDYIISLERFPPINTSIDVLDKRLYYGGTAANLATTAASLGVPTAIVSYVGGDFPQDFEDFMRSKGVLLDDLVVVKGEQTPTVWVVSDAVHDQIAYVFQGAMKDMETYEIRTDMAVRSKEVHIYTGRPGYYMRLMRELSQKGIKISFDPAQEIHHIWSEETFSEALPMSSILFANRGELETAMRYMSVKEPQEMLTQVGVIINTRGSEGSVIYTIEEEIHVPAIKTKKVVDTTGAGDAFRAGFYAGRYRGYDLHDCAILGSATSSFAVESMGGLSNIPIWEKVLERAEDMLR
ncbi:MAG: carbohydrate kinase family protein [Methanomassiliicoccales archaeon]|nr:carbohydrate kinase family protein [Methanomassiliicoccales archaeon]NYT15969.1 carbohydrate kinase family protein [Methanomassiliicoccales archaeon]